MNQNKGTIGRWQGAGLMATTLLGTGVFILPQMTIVTAGQGALIAWLVLTLAIIPVTLVFGRLASLLPHAAGPAYFVEQAYGRTAGRTIGLMFLLVVPIGAPAAILMTFQFVNALVPLSGWAQVGTELLLLGVLLLLNSRGIQVSAKLQFALTLAIVSVVVALFGGVGLSLSELESFAHQDTPDISLIMAAVGIAFWSFLGIEAMTHLANDFRQPKQDMIPAMLIGTVLVGVVYLACTLLLLMVPSDTPVAMVGVFDSLLGGYGAPVIGILGIVSGLATVNVYTASVSRLIWSFSRDGVLPKYFSQLNQHQSPARAATAVLFAMALVIIITYATGQQLEDLIAWSNGVFVIIYLAAMFAAAKLLSKRYLPLVILSCALCAVIGFALGWNMAYAILLMLILFPILWAQKSHLSRRQALV
ncbi:L-methionine/branched-chain amino acid transporter [Shewanella sp. KX20019]|uniref:L-methionine/branched-chain amino acid transporter n=1 Tax=Shewanella sp. KX20019 TaxID=2803864 RepID=UPI001928169C|nr:L-methionine/branched-chain amino acid transporter [Shewanella sp. KX20019]QQX80614.1 L-methionine/branched-chain amino acid transporter [Shewanella sp. KX20019]